MGNTKGDTRRSAIRRWSIMNDLKLETNHPSVAEQKIGMLEGQVSALEREKRGLQEMLFLVLDEIGEPVEISEEVIAGGIKGDKMIDITNQDGVWVFKVIHVA